MKTYKKILFELENGNLNYFSSIRLISTLLATSGIGSSANAQVQYTDVNPDFLWPYNGNTGYLLDLNNDGIDDFKLIRKSESWWCGAGGAYGPNYYGGKWGLILENLGTPTWNRSRLDSTTSCSYFFQKVQVMQAGTLLALNPSSWSNYNPQVPWKAISGAYSGCSAPCSYYNSNSQNVDMFIGLRIVVPGSYHLGWLRILLVANFVIIKDYAFETTPYRPIIIGATTSSVGINDIEGTTKINLNNRELSIQFLKEASKYEVQISNLTGQLIESNIKVNSLWNYTFNQPGVYLLTITNETGKFTKKLFVF